MEKQALQQRPAFSGPADVREIYNAALENLLEINTVPADFTQYDRTGLLNREAPFLIRAGGEYQTPWTRDANINSWCAASLLEPSIAQNTLLSVCQRDDAGRCVIQMDNQDWDKIIWAAGALDHWHTTGDDAFLATAYPVITAGLEVLEGSRYREAFGLFAGGSFFNDGISGYPADLHQPGNSSSFVGDHPANRAAVCLSTNCLYYHAYRAAAEMAAALENTEAAAILTQKGDRLKAAIRRRFWDSESHTLHYLLYPDGRVARFQEGCGITFALLFGLTEPAESAQLLEGVERSERGLVSITPPFPGLFSQEKPGRHNNLIWPFLNGMFITAAARLGKAELVGNEFDCLTRLIQDSDGAFCEIYNPYTGRPDGGWQCGRHWHSCRHQTWSASGYLAAIYKGIFGIQPTREGLRLTPCVPRRLADASLAGLTVRGMELRLLCHGSGSRCKRILVNGSPLEADLLPWQTPGLYEIEYQFR